MYLNTRWFSVVLGGMKRQPRKQEVSLFEPQRGGRVYSQHGEKVTTNNLMEVLRSVCTADAHFTDAGVLRKQRTGLVQHSLVNHRGDEYVRYEEGFYFDTLLKKKESPSIVSVVKQSEDN
jgi:hypothetical protein